jgi:hypothetical protein
MTRYRAVLVAFLRERSSVGMRGSAMKTGKHAPNFVLNRLQHRKKRVRRYGLVTAPLPSKIQIDRSMAIFLPRSSLDTSASVGKCSAHETAPSVLADSASASSAFSASALVFAGLLHGSSKDQNSFPPPIGNLAIARRCERSESGRYQADHLQGFMQTLRGHSFQTMSLSRPCCRTPRLGQAGLSRRRGFKPG